MVIVRLESLQRAIAAVAFVLLAAGTFQPFYLRIFFTDRAAMRSVLTELPYRQTPGLRSFLMEARKRTRPDEIIVFLAPYDTWEGGYRYSIRGARYALAGRTVRGVIGPDEVDLSSNLDRAEAVVAWRVPVPPGWEVVWSGNDGSVARRSAGGSR